MNVVQCQVSNLQLYHGWSSYLWWDEDDVCFVLNQQTEFGLYIASSLKQECAGRHVAPLGHIILTVPTTSSLKQECAGRHVAPLGHIILTLCQPLAHWNKSVQVDMLLHSDTLYWLCAKQSLLLLIINHAVHEWTRLSGPAE